MSKFLDSTGLSHFWSNLKALLQGKLDTTGTAKKSAGILYGTVDSTSTATVFTATVPGLTALYDGAAVMLKNGVITSASGFTININGLGAKPVYTNLAAATAETTKFNINYTLLFTYDESRVDGGCWICYNGYDSNTNTIGYQLRGNSSSLPASDKGVKYRLWFTSADGTKFVPANTSTSTSASASKTPNTRPIDPFGRVVYCGASSTYSAGTALSTTNIWDQYVFALGYSFNTTNAALTLTFPAPVYLKLTPQADGSAVLGEVVQALPTSADGYVYMWLGLAYSATNIELFPHHPIYYYKDGGIRRWNGEAIS